MESEIDELNRMANECGIELQIKSGRIYGYYDNCDDECNNYFKNVDFVNYLEKCDYNKFVRYVFKEW
jgi:hypothetical protein